MAARGVAGSHLGVDIGVIVPLVVHGQRGIEAVPLFLHRPGLRPGIQDRRGFLIPGLAQAEGDAEAGIQPLGGVGGLTEDGVGGVVDGVAFAQARGRGDKAGGQQCAVERHQRIPEAVELFAFVLVVVQPNDVLQAIVHGTAEDLELLGPLLVVLLVATVALGRVVEHRYAPGAAVVVGTARRNANFHFPIAGDRLDVEVVGTPGQGQAVAADVVALLADIVEVEPFLAVVSDAGLDHLAEGVIFRPRQNHAGGRNDRQIDVIGIGVAQLGRARGTLTPGAVQGVIGGQAVRQLPVQCQAVTAGIIAAEFTRAAGVAVARPALVGAVQVGQFCSQATHARQVQCGLRAGAAKAAQGQLLLEAEFPQGPRGNDVDGAAGGVLAIQRALGAAQDFDALEIGDVENGTGVLANVDTVQVEPDLGVLGQGRLVGRDTPHRGRHADVAARGGQQNGVGDAAGNAGDIHDAQVLQ